MTESGKDRGFDEESWKRLKNVMISIETYSMNFEMLKSQLDDDKPCSENIIALNLAALIKHKNYKISKLKRKMENIQKMYISRNRSKIEVEEKLKKKEEDFQQLQMKTNEMSQKCIKNEEKKNKQRKTILLLTRLSAHRKTQMIQEIVEVFKIEIDGGPASRTHQTREKRECKCVLIDTIRGLHLPHATSIQAFGHNETETASAVGYLIHALEAICTVLEYTFRYPTLAAQSNSQIFHPLEDKVIQFYGWKRRLDRDRFAEGVVLLGRNLTQLRADCGIPTPIADKTLLILFDWVQAISGGKYIKMFQRPTESVFSPASLLIKYE